MYLSIIFIKTEPVMFFITIKYNVAVTNACNYESFANENNI